jgi:hypothetical protein
MLMTKSATGCWVNPHGDIVFLSEEMPTHDVVLDEYLPELAQLWKTKWEPAGEDYDIAVVDYALSKGWVQVCFEDDGMIFIVADSALSNDTKVKVIRMVENRHPTKIYWQGKGMDRPTVVNIEELKQGL